MARCRGLALALAVAGGCCERDDERAEQTRRAASPTTAQSSPAVKHADATKPAAAVAADVLPPLPSVLATLDRRDPASWATAVDLFTSRHRAPSDAAARLVDLTALLAFGDDAAFAQHEKLYDDPLLSAALERRTNAESIPGDDPGEAALVALERSGFEVHERDGTTVHVDHRWLATQIGPTLSAEDRAWLDAVAIEAAGMQVMQASDPHAMSSVIARWEEIVDAGGPHGADARKRLPELLGHYLALCLAPEDGELARCHVTPSMRASYHAHATGPAKRSRAAVACFERRGEAKRWRFADDALHAAIRGCTPLLVLD